MTTESTLPPPPPPQAPDPRRRLRELLTIPERDRTDAQWDEIVELEIQLAPGNRAGPAPAGNMGSKPQNQQQKQKHRPKGNFGRHPAKKNNPP